MTVTGGKSTTGGWQRLFARLLPALRWVGIPAFALAVTGGVHTIPFWIGAVMRLVLAVAAGFFFAPLAMIPIAIGMALGYGVARLVRLPIRGRFDPEYDEYIGFGWIAASLLVWWKLPLEFQINEYVRIPLGNPAIGVPLVVGIVTAAIRGTRKPALAYRQRHLPTAARAAHPKSLDPEPEEEFWSAEPVVGYRRWRWNGNSLVGMQEPWPKAVHRATCSSCLEVPGWNHTCGIYATKRKGLAYPEGTVLGKVELTGLVIEHEAGYRARTARIVELWTDGSVDPAALRRRYPGVTVHGRPPV